METSPNYSHKKALLLDMNSTFMFGEDRFGEHENFYNYYANLNGVLDENTLNTIIRSAYHYLDVRYPDEQYRHCFPSLQQAIEATCEKQLSREETQKIIETFAYHELGHIPQDYVSALHNLHERYRLAGVIDIWSPKALWLDAFQNANIDHLFSALSFSSDHGMVKPSPKPFENVVSQLGLCKEDCLVIGDSVRRDLGGAIAAGIDCLLVGKARDDRALACYPTLLAFEKVIRCRV